MPFHKVLRSWIIDHRKTTNYELRSQSCKPKGFTLIELLIVISIIGILASLGLTTFTSAQAKGRDSVRKSDLAQLKRTLELAKSDCQGSAYYPAPSFSSRQANYTALGNHLKSTALNYFSSYPTDPKNTANQTYGYDVQAAGGNFCPDSNAVANNLAAATDYLLSVQLERTVDPDAAGSVTRCAGKPGLGNLNGAGWYVICNN